MLTIAEGDFLRNVYQLTTNNQTVGFKDVAKRLNISVATVTATAKRLAKKELVIYYEYKGIALTESGIKEAKHVANAHYLWEFFLTNKLGMSLDEVHEEAHHLEHATSKKVLERLYLFLGSPTQCPYGEVIELEISQDAKIKSMPLTTIKCNQRVNILPNNSFNQLLEDLSLPYKAYNIEIIKIFENGDVMVVDQHQQRYIIPECVACDVMVVEGDGYEL